MLFSICPCTIAIALLLPVLVSVFYRNQKEIQLRDDSLTRQSDEFHTIVFDKTGTLTTGDSIVESSDISSNALWQRIYLLEKLQGAEHPLAKAITRHYESNFSSNLMIDEIKLSKTDPKNRGISGLVQGKQIHIGNAAYLQESQVVLPDLNNFKSKQGFTPVYVAEDRIYRGVIYIQHELRPGVLPALSRLKDEKKKLILLTGDTLQAALAFNEQIGFIFKPKHIHTEQTPEKKAKFLEELCTSPEKAKGICFVGDGLNDAPCAKIVSEKGGLSCAMNAGDKAAFFTDLCLNGSLDYLFCHHKINGFLQKIILQNKAILIFSTLVFLTLITSCSVAGIACSSLIFLVIMLSTTLFILANSARIQLFIDNALDKSVLAKAALASDLSFSLLLVGSTLLICSLLIATIATGGLALPVAVFTTSLALTLSSSFTLTAIVLFSLFIVLVTSHVVVENVKDKPLADTAVAPAKQIPISPAVFFSPGVLEEKSYNFGTSNNTTTTNSSTSYDSNYPAFRSLSAKSKDLATAMEPPREVGAYSY